MATGDRHYLEEELERLVQSDPDMWRFLREGSLDGVWYWDLEKPDNEWMSPEMWRLFGVDPATKTHDPAEWQDLIFTEDLDVALENFQKHCADPDHPYDQIVRYRHADGSTVWVRCRGMAIRDETGKPIRMLGAHNDITAVKRAEERAREDKRSVDAANEELRSFAYSISHDLKSPANTLEMLLERVSNDSQSDFSEQTRVFLEHGRNTVSRMQKIIEEVLVYTRSIGRELKLASVDLNDVMSATIEDLAADIEASGAVFETGKLPAVWADETQIRTLFQNLVANAIKFRREDLPPKIAVTAELAAQSGRCQITVADNGIGISQEMQDRIFTLFAKLHSHDEYDGAGIGLTLCRRIAANHGGDITVVSSEGAGAAFTVELPRPPA